jgi:glycosyltransferase involved in cell wall biosynthesis
MGKLGLEICAHYGWKRDIMFPFMYNPVIFIKKDAAIRETVQDGKIRFLYVGRFYFKTKGIDILMKATEMLKGNWQLDLVGGYGKDKEKVINWVKKQRNVDFIGSWQSQDVCTNMMGYDVIVVPSRCDGWNLLANEAIYAGIGTIITDKATSDELISTSGAGMVVPADNPKAMAKAMQQVIDNPDLAKQWKENTENYRDRTLPKTVGEYFMDVLDYTFYNYGQNRPRCPWL